MQIFILVAALVTGTFGIAIGIFAAVKLFKQGVGITKIENLLSPAEQAKASPADLYRNLAKLFNDSIGDTNARSLDGFKGDRARWINKIWVGAAFSVISLILSTLASWPGLLN